MSRTSGIILQHVLLEKFLGKRDFTSSSEYKHCSQPPFHIYSAASTRLEWSTRLSRRAFHLARNLFFIDSSSNRNTSCMYSCFHLAGRSHRNNPNTVSSVFVALLHPRDNKSNRFYTIFLRLLYRTLRLAHFRQGTGFRDGKQHSISVELFSAACFADPKTHRQMGNVFR